jgi:hypothetical protein
MIQKSEKCLYFGEKMESKTAKKKFCSTLHRVYWNRENKKSSISIFDKTIDLIWACKNSRDLLSIVHEFKNGGFNEKETHLFNAHIKRVCDSKKIKL